MKHKKLFRSVTALLAALVLMGGFSVTAFAGGGDVSDEPPTPVTETEPEETTGGYEPQPLTPEGNMSLVDDITGEASGDKQFITVVTKNGNYFYIIIDRAEDGKTTAIRNITYCCYGFFGQRIGFQQFTGISITPFHSPSFFQMRFTSAYVFAFQVPRTGSPFTFKVAFSHQSGTRRTKKNAFSSFDGFGASVTVSFTAPSHFDNTCFCTSP